MVEPGSVREATPADDDDITAIARAHGFDDADSAIDGRYRRFVAAHGRLVVALVAGQVVGFGGAIDADGVRMVTDLFLLAEHQGRGLGGAMLDALVGDAEQRMTFSSAHERAVPSYRRMGMEPRWRLQYWSGVAPVDPVARYEVVEVVPEQWQGDRPDLADHWSARGGRLLHIRDAGRLAGWSIVVPAGPGANVWDVARLSTALPHDVALRDVLSVIPVGAAVHVCTPERSTAARLLERVGFATVEHDIFCATDGVDLSAELAALHPGLG